MGRCSGCGSDRCSCVIKAGSGTRVDGVGTRDNPYVISLEGGGGGGGGRIVGEIVAFGGSLAPAGWLVANGQAVSRSAYSSLFSAIGTVYGTGDGATTFNVPDLAGRFPLGSDGSHPMGSDTAGGTIDRGAETATLTMAHVPQHNHTIAHTHTMDHGHSASAGATGTDHQHSFATGESGAHSHSYLTRGGAVPQGNGNVVAAAFAFTVGTTSGGSHSHSGTTGFQTQNVVHNHSVSVGSFSGSTSGASTPNSGNAGSASPTPIKTMPPWTGITYIIKT